MSAKMVKEELVGDVFERIVTTPAKVSRGQTLKEAVEAILKVPITRKVYVVDSTGKLEGVIKVETILRHAGYRMGVRKSGIASYFKMLSEVFKDKVEDIMEKPITVTKKDTIARATKLMVENHLNDLSVVDENGILIGEINSMEILSASIKLFEDKL
ncbi:MAG: CBS domain-containing protein [Thermoplasmata archaeon]